MIKHFQCDEATKDSIYIGKDYAVWGSSDSINRLTDHLDELEGQIESLKASELAHRLLYERSKEQNALLVEALGKGIAALKEVSGPVSYGRWSTDFRTKVERVQKKMRQALAAVKEMK